MSTYKIVRFYANTSFDREVVAEDLTLEEAKEHCSYDEASSNTCTTPEGADRTARRGAWFEGFEKE